MENPFELLKPSPYVSTNIGLPLQELQLASQRLSDMNQKNISAMDELDILFSNIKANPYDKAAPEIIEKAKANVYKDIEDIANLENKTASPQASQLIRQAYKKFASDKGLQKVMENYELYDRYDKMVEKERAEGKVIDLLPNEFQSVTTDEDGNPVYNTWSNPYRVYNGWEEKEMDIWNNILKEVFIDAGVEMPSAQEMATKPFAEIFTTRGISMDQVNQKIDAAFNSYMQTPQGLQKLEVLKHRMPEADEAEIVQAMKEDFRQKGGLKTYMDTSKRFTNIPESFYKNLFNNGSGNEGIMLGPSTTYEIIPQEDIIEVLDKDYNPVEDPEGFTLKQSLFNSAFYDDNFLKDLNQSLSNKSNWDITGNPKNSWVVKAFNVISKSAFPQILGEDMRNIVRGIAVSKDPKKSFETLLKEYFPKEFEQSSFDGELDYKTLHKNLNNYLSRMAEKGSDDYMRNKIKTFYNSFIEEAVKDYYSKGKNKDNTYQSYGYIFNGSTEGKALSNELSTNIKSMGTSSNINPEFSYNIKSFDPEKFEYDLNSIDINGIDFVNGDFVFKSNVKGNYNGEGEKVHEIGFRVDDDIALQNLFAPLPTSLQSRFKHFLNARGTDIIEPGASHYIGKDGSKIPFPKGFTIGKLKGSPDKSEEYTIFYNGSPIQLSAYDPATKEKIKGSYKTPRNQVQALIGLIMELSRSQQ